MADLKIIESNVGVRDARVHLRSVVGSGPDVLIVHGWPESSAAWLPVLERAAGAVWPVYSDRRELDDVQP